MWHKARDQSSSRTRSLLSQFSVLPTKSRLWWVFLGNPSNALAAGIQFSGVDTPTGLTRLQGACITSSIRFNPCCVHLEILRLVTNRGNVKRSHSKGMEESKKGECRLGWSSPRRRRERKKTSWIPCWTPDVLVVKTETEQKTQDPSSSGIACKNPPCCMTDLAGRHPLNSCLPGWCSRYLLEDSTPSAPPPFPALLLALRIRPPSRARRGE